MRNRKVFLNGKCGGIHVWHSECPFPIVYKEFKTDNKEGPHRKSKTYVNGTCTVRGKARHSSVRNRLRKGKQVNWMGMGMGSQPGQGEPVNFHGCLSGSDCDCLSNGGNRKK